jgi:hypothetical protein
MNIFGRLSCCVLLAMAALATPAWGRVVNLTSAAPLADRSDASMDRAIKAAVDTCVRRATAMGLSWIWLEEATVAGDKIFVHMVATDDEAEGAGGVKETDVTVDQERRVIDAAPSDRLVEASPPTSPATRSLVPARGAGRDAAD